MCKHVTAFLCDTVWDNRPLTYAFYKWIECADKKEPNRIMLK